MKYLLLLLFVSCANKPVVSPVPTKEYHCVVFDPDLKNVYFGLFTADISEEAAIKTTEQVRQRLLEQEIIPKTSRIICSIRA